MQPLRAKSTRDHASNCHAIARFMHNHNRGCSANRRLGVSRRVPLHRYQVVRAVADRSWRRKSHQIVAAPGGCRFKLHREFCRRPRQIRETLFGVFTGLVTALQRIGRGKFAANTQYRSVAFAANGHCRG